MWHAAWHQQRGAIGSGELAIRKAEATVALDTEEPLVTQTHPIASAPAPTLRGDDMIHSLSVPLRQRRLDAALETDAQ